MTYSHEEITLGPDSIPAIVPDDSRIGWLFLGTHAERPLSEKIWTERERLLVAEGGRWSILGRVSA